MRLSSYRLAIVVCLISVTVQCLVTLGAITRLVTEPFPFGRMFSWFGIPIPAPFLAMVPWFIRVTLMIVFAGLLYRRVWLAIKARTFHPPALLGVWPARLLVVAAASLFVGIAVLVLSFLLRAGSDVLAGMFALLAALLLAPVLFYVELRAALPARAGVA